MPKKEKKPGWRDVARDSAFDPGAITTPDRDPRGRMGNEKEVGYPVGTMGYFVDGRFLRGIRSGSHTALILMAPAAGFGTLGPVQIEPHGQKRGLYLPEILVQSLIAQEDITIEWQIWSDGHRVANGTQSPAYQPLELYFPPFSNQTFYARWANAAAAPPINVRMNISLRWIEFDTEGEIYEYGEGSNTDNPGVNDIDWPGFA